MARTEWLKLRAFDGSQEAAFEALCKQLAVHESYPADATFVPKGNPDGGVECYWKLSTGEEHGWQAKFFIGPLESAQWQQLDKSVKSALAKHPHLTQYTVCLPLDLPDARSGTVKSARAKWNERISKWSGWARARGRNCTFVLWDDHELHSRLWQEQNRGRYRFFFDKEVFTDDWFGQHLEAQIQVAGARYTPELHVELDIAKTFDAAIRGPHLTQAWLDQVAEFVKAAKGLYFGNLNKSLRQDAAKLQRACQRCLDEMLALGLEMPEQIRSYTLESLLDLADNRLEALLERLKRSAKRFEKKNDAPYTSTPYEAARAALWTLQRMAHGIREFLDGALVHLANGQPLLIRGEAGTGKTHALCDFASRNRANGGCTVICFGTQFRDDALLPQICSRLGLSFSSWDEFLGALSAAAEFRGTPAVLCIDALNEATDASVWEKELPPLYAAVSRFPWVRLFLSVRTPLEELFIPSHLASVCVPVDHYGFGEQYIQAAAKFFDHYELEGLRAPPLVPELQNPLFLKLYCKAHRGSKAEELVGGTRSLQQLFDSLIAHTQSELARRGVAGIDPHGKEIATALEQIAGRMIESRQSFVPRDLARHIVDSATSSPGIAFADSPFAYLIREGLLLEIPLYEQGAVQPKMAIAFGYQRFTDFLIAQCLVNMYIDPGDVTDAFRPGSPLTSWMCDRGTFSYFAGVYTMLAIIVAERFDKELPTLLAEVEESPFDWRVFLESVVWRSPSAVSDKLATWVVKNGFEASRSSDIFLETLLTLAMTPNHPLNARALHHALAKMTMAERDTRWTIPVQELYRWGDRGALHTLLHWSWSGRYDTHDYLRSCSPDAVGLGAVVLFWCFSLSDRRIRDSATKAAVDLVSAHPKQLPTLLRLFSDVDDSYVTERVAAVALGVGTRVKDTQLLCEIVKALHESFYVDRQPPANQLFRDYARRLVALARERGVKSIANCSQMEGPQKTYLRKSPPALDTLEQRFKKRFKESRGFGLLESSIIHGDFIHYVARLPSGSRKDLKRRNGVRQGIEPQKLGEPNFVKRWLLRRVIELGWHPKRFERFDASIGYQGRMTHEVERIGKKYQWIAWRELISRCCDTYQLVIEESPWGESDSEEMLWLDAARADIDPTLTAYRSHDPGWGDAASNWWSPASYNNWLPDSQRVMWLKRTRDIPDAKSLVTVTKQDCSSQWVVLSVGYHWSKKESLAIVKREEILFQIFLSISAYLIRRDDKDKLMAWACKQRFLGDWMPSGREVGRYSGAYLGEFPEQPMGTEQWVGPGSMFRGSDLPCAMLPLKWSYLCESGYDNSINEGISLDLLCPSIARAAKLTHFTGDGKLRTVHGDLVVEDPSLDSPGQSALVVRRDWLQQELLRDEYSLFWTVVGEKNSTKMNGAREYVGHREINGYYVLDRDEIRGRVSTEFVTPEMTAERHKKETQGTLGSVINFL